MVECGHVEGRIWGYFFAKCHFSAFVCTHTFSIDPTHCFLNETRGLSTGFPSFGHSSVILIIGLIFILVLGHVMCAWSRFSSNLSSHLLPAAERRHHSLLELHPASPYGRFQPGDEWYLTFLTQSTWRSGQQAPFILVSAAKLKKPG